MACFPSSVHAHTTFCDGKNTPEEMVLSAIRQGLSVIGFSGHTYVPYDDFGMQPDVIPAYIEEINRLKTAYAGQIDVLLGIEIDPDAPETDLSPFDYVIGSSHSVRDRNGTPWIVDGGPEALRRAIFEGFGGDALALAAAYFEQLADFVLLLRPTIVGHFDLLTKFNEKHPMIDTDDPMYRAAASKALDRVLDAGLICEVNTGAISRGWRQTPYPAPFLLKQILARGSQVTLTADTHAADSITCAFDETLALLKRTGFRQVLTLTKNGFASVAL